VIWHNEANAADGGGRECLADRHNVLSSPLSIFLLILSILFKSLRVGKDAGTVAQSMHTGKHPGGEKNSHFVIPAGLLGRNPVY
jgi:hypothetical protein